MHVSKVRLAGNVDLDEIASLTAGFTGADLANLVNEAALVATRRGAETVEKDDFIAAIERIVAGLEKRNRLLNEFERTVVAHHEMGHAMVAASLPGSDPVHKISIIPRGIGALGYTIQRPTEDRYLMTRDELENKMAVLLGGRAAEHHRVRASLHRRLRRSGERDRHRPQHGASLRYGAGAGARRARRRARSRFSVIRSRRGDTARKQRERSTARFVTW